MWWHWYIWVCKWEIHCDGTDIKVWWYWSKWNDGTDWISLCDSKYIDIILMHMMMCWHLLKMWCTYEIDNVIHSVGVRKIYVTASMQMKFRMCLYECQMTLNYNVLQKWWYAYTRHWNNENNVNHIIEDCFYATVLLSGGSQSWGIFKQFMTSGETFIVAGEIRRRDEILERSILAENSELQGELYWR